MSNYYGFAGTSLYVNLTSKEIKREPLAPKLAQNYIGGMGVASKLLYDLVPPNIDPLSPENVLIFATGPLIGTLAPGAARAYAMTKSPMSGLLGQASGGHGAGSMLKYSGYDNLIISGRAEKPVYLKIFDDNIELLDASHLWGKDTLQTVDLIREELGSCSVNCIGPAGENLVRFANILGDKRSGFNKTGLGAVMGSKNLKAIAARGTKGVVVADRKRFQGLVDQILTRLATSPRTNLHRQYSTAAEWSADREGFRREDFRQRVRKRNYACLACPVGCKQLISLQGGNFDGLTFNVTALPSLANHHRMARVENWDELAKCVELENKYGLDGAAMAGVVNLMAQLQEKGITTKADTDGLTITWGGETIRRLIPLITYKKGIGALLAEGAKIAAQKIGKGAERYANHVKGVQKEPDIGKRFSTAEFGRATNTRGGHGHRAKCLTGIAETDPESFRKYCLGLGVPETVLDSVCRGPHGYNVARLTKWTENFNSVAHSMGVCGKESFEEQIDLETLATLYEAATGFKTSPAELLKAGERIWNLQKIFNINQGWSRKDDIPNTRLPDEVIVVDEKSYGTFNQLLNEYYDERGWDVKTGIPPAKKLAELGLDGLLDPASLKRKASTQ